MNGLVLRASFIALFQFYLKPISLSIRMWIRLRNFSSSSMIITSICSLRNLDSLINYLLLFSKMKWFKEYSSQTTTFCILFQKKDPSKKLARASVFLISGIVFQLVLLSAMNFPKFKLVASPWLTSAIEINVLFSNLPTQI